MRPLKERYFSSAPCGGGRCSAPELPDISKNSRAVVGYETSKATTLRNDSVALDFTPVDQLEHFTLNRVHFGNDALSLWTLEAESVSVSIRHREVQAALEKYRAKFCISMPPRIARHVEMRSSAYLC